MKEKLKLRDSNTTLIDLDDISFLRDLSLIIDSEEGIHLTIAGMLFVGKEKSIKQLLPQAELIYLHYNDNNLEEYDNRIDLRMPIISALDRLAETIKPYNRITNIQVGLFRIEVYDFSEKVFQEAILNAFSHRRYDSPGAIYVKHYPNRIVIESPGGFVDDITEDNIITHPSVARNKLIAETLQRLKYVQRSGQGIDIIFKEMVSMGKRYPEYVSYGDAIRLTLYSTMEDVSFVEFIIETQEKKQRTFNLPELMILRYLYENKTISLTEASKITQIPIREIKHIIQEMNKQSLVESSGKVYMLTAKVYSKVKSKVEYVQDKSVTYLKAKDLVLEYLEENTEISNAIIQELCRCTKRQSDGIIKKMKEAGLLAQVGQGRGTKYILK